MTRQHVPADTEEPGSEPAPVYRTRTGEVIGAATHAAQIAARWTPQSLVQVICLVLLSVLVAGFAAVLWVNQEASRARDREMRDQSAAQIREANAREELRNMHCAAEAEKMRLDNVKARVDAAETLKTVLTAFQAEGERGRAFQATENEKFRKEITLAITGKPAP